MLHSGRNPRLDGFFVKGEEARRWQEEYGRLRTTILDCQLTEVLKWMHPCYTLDGKNIVLIHGFKEYCAVLFFKGALLKDPHGILVQQTANVQAERQIRFTNLQDVIAKESILREYVLEAIEVEKAGLQVEYKKTTEFTLPEEFQSRLDVMPELETAFAALTPGRQRGYLLYFSQPKQAKTRAARVDKCLPQILAGKGLDD
jgi:uncharacterized protein YdeI (YjbR/CyaY-like superfamily)